MDRAFYFDTLYPLQDRVLKVINTMAHHPSRLQLRQGAADASPMKADPSLPERPADLGGRSPEEPSGRGEDARAHLLRREKRDDLNGRIEDSMPRASQLPGIGRVPGKGERSHLFGGVPARACGALQDRRRAKAWVFRTRGPGDVTEGLEAIVGPAHADPVP